MAAINPLPVKQNDRMKIREQNDIRATEQGAQRMVLQRQRFLTVYVQTGACDPVFSDRIAQGEDVIAQAARLVQGQPRGIEDAADQIGNLGFQRVCLVGQRDGHDPFVGFGPGPRDQTGRGRT